MFGSCIIHSLYTECAKIKKKIRRQKVNHNSAAFGMCCWIALMKTETAVYTEYELTLKIKPVLLRYVSTQFSSSWVRVDNSSSKYSNFATPILKIFKKCLPAIFQTYTHCEFLLPLLLLKTRYELSASVLLNFLLKEVKVHIQLSHAPHNYPCWRLWGMVVA